MHHRLIRTHTPSGAQGAVLLLHGGAAKPNNPMVSPTQLSVLRMIPIARRIARRGGKRLAVFRLLNSSRGWDTQQTPVADARWALEQIRDLYPGIPVALVGHSLGARAALLAARESGVASVVALNAYVVPGDRYDLADRQTLFVHGLADRIAGPARAEAAARAAGARFVGVADGKHAMLGFRPVFDRLAEDWCAATLLGDEPGEVVARSLRGEDGIVV